MKKLLSVLLGVMMLVSVFNISAFAAADSIRSFAMNFYSNEKTSPDTIYWKKGSTNYYMYVPSDADLANAVIYFDATQSVYVGSTKIVSGEKNTVFTQPGKTYTLKCGDASYNLSVYQSANIPSVYITTQSGSLDYIHASKENKEGGSIRTYENGQLTLDCELKQIKGRGNSTWTFEKKPYNIKFDKKTAFLGMEKAKKWTLLASYQDPQLISNPISWSIADQLGLKYTSLYRHIDLYINNEYLGNYIACESVEIGTTRVDINDLASDNEKANPGVDIDALSQSGSLKNGAVPTGNDLGSQKWINIPNNPDNITGGYLLELEYASRYNSEKSGFVTKNGQCVVIKEPEAASKVEVEYISTYFEEMYDALLNENGINSKGKHYSDYIDMDSFVSMYIVEELSKEVDAGFSSVYICKDKDSDKFVFSPVWDFDQGNGNTKYNPYKIRLNDPETWYANSVFYGASWEGNKTPTPTVFNLAFRHDDFRKAVNEKWTSYISSSKYNEMKSYISNLADKIEASAQLNAIRWGHYSSYSAGDKPKAFRSNISDVMNYYDARTAALTKGFSGNSAMIYYDANGGTGFVIEPQILEIGDSVTVLAPNSSDNMSLGVTVTSPSSEKKFYGWSTKKNGSGETYKPGDRITLTSKKITLYAKWLTDDEAASLNSKSCSHICHSNNSFMKFIWKIGLMFSRLFGINKTCDCGIKHY